LPLLAQPVERGRLARDEPGLHRGQPAPARVAREDDRADATDQRAVSLRGDGEGTDGLKAARPSALDCPAALARPSGRRSLRATGPGESPPLVKSLIND